MPLTILNVILIIAASQGFFLAILIFFRHGKLFANRFLSLYIFIYSLIILDLLIWDLHLYQNRPYLRVFTLILPFIMVPLHYLYVKYLTTSEQTFRRRDLLHFTPIPFIYALFLLPTGASREALLELMHFDVRSQYPLQFVIFNWAILFQTMVYLSLTLFLLRKYRRNIKRVFSNIGKVQLNWLRNLTLVMIFIVSFFLVENVLLLVDIHISEAFTLSSAVVAMSVYIIGYMGMSKTDIYLQQNIARSMKELPNLRASKHSGKAGIKYSKSGLAETTAKAYLDELLGLMKEERPYRDSELTLPQLATRLGISPHNLSQVLNAGLGQNFFDFINSYRINEVIEGLKDPDKQHLKILAIAFDAGFNSKTTFNSIFKKVTGITPSEYRRHLS